MINDDAMRMYKKIFLLFIDVVFVLVTILSHECFIMLESKRSITIREINLAFNSISSLKNKLASY